MQDTVAALIEHGEDPDIITAEVSKMLYVAFSANSYDHGDSKLSRAIMNTFVAGQNRILLHNRAQPCCISQGATLCRS